MKKIIVITTSFPIQEEGTEAAGGFVCDFVNVLSQTNVVTVIAPGGKDYLEKRKIGTNLSVQRYYSPNFPLSLLKIIKIDHWYHIIKILVSGRNALDKVLKREQYDHILALWVLPSGYWAKYASRKYNIPYSTWALGSDIWSLSRIPFIKGVLKNVLKKSTCNWADGYLLKKDVENLSKKKCGFLTSSRSLSVKWEDSREVQKTPHRLAFLGRWHENKGVDILLRSLNMLDEKSWQKIEVVNICGGGPLESLVKEEVNRLIQKGYPIKLGGYLNKNQATELLCMADFVMIPSRIESIPVIFSDSMQCLTPVISMPVGDLEYIIKKFDVGVVAKHVSSSAFAIAIGKALSSSPIKFKSNLVEAAQFFSIEKSVGRFIETVTKE